METEQIVYYNLEVSQKLRIHKAVSKKSEDPDAFSEIDHEFENKELRLKIDIFRGCNSANLCVLKLTVPLIFFNLLKPTRYVMTMKLVAHKKCWCITLLTLTS